MTHSAREFALILALIACQTACSASDAGPPSGGASAGSSDHGGSGGTGDQAGGPAGGTNSATGGTAAGGAASGGAASGGQSSGGNSGSGGTSAGSSGSGMSGGSGGAAVSCTPGTGTQPVGDKSLLDRQTCLVWTKDRSTMTLTNKQAYKYCNELVQDGISDWRVPSPEELVTWPDLLTDSTAYITGPIYIPNNATSVMDGCTGDSHSCNIAKYNDTSVTCGWQGVGFTGWVACVSGTATAGSTNSAYSAANCSPCNSELASFTVTDCSAYAN